MLKVKYVFTQTLCHWMDAIQGQFLKQIIAGLNLKFTFFNTRCYNKAK